MLSWNMSRHGEEDQVCTGGGETCCPALLSFPSRLSSSILSLFHLTRLAFTRLSSCPPPSVWLELCCFFASSSVFSSSTCFNFTSHRWFSASSFLNFPSRCLPSFDSGFPALVLPRPVPRVNFSSSASSFARQAFSLRRSLACFVNSWFLELLRETLSLLAESHDVRVPVVHLLLHLVHLPPVVQGV